MLKKMQEMPITLNTLILLISLISAGFAFDKTYARESQVISSAIDLKQMQVQHSIEELDDELWLLERLDNPTGDDKALIERYQRRLMDKQQQMRDLEKMK